MKLSVICVAFFVTYVSCANYQEGKKGPRCYDCNYAPSGYVLNKATGADHLSRVGYQSCALRSAYDKKHVDKWGCKSGMCFIRKDYNGLVYRGCADKDNLPWGVDSSRNCQYQGPNKSLWFFCKGDLCNEGQLGESANLCGAPVGPHNDKPQPQPGKPQPQPSDKREYGKMGPAGEGYGIRENNRNFYGQNVQNNNGYQASNQNGYVAESNQIAPKVNTYDSTSQGFCNGDCYHNPSGIFPYSQDAKFFIQCEADFHGNHPCTCCKPTVLPCPYGTTYNDDYKVCIDY